VNSASLSTYMEFPRDSWTCSKSSSNGAGSGRGPVCAVPEPGWKFGNCSNGTRNSCMTMQATLP
jgi:hypothetical protein